MDYSGKIIKKTPVTPSQTSASGVWTLDDAAQAQRTNTWPVANVPNPISRSLRFRSSASAYLNRTPASAGNRQTWTWSAWVKRGTLGTDQYIFTAHPSSETAIRFTSANVIEFYAYSGGYQFQLITSQVFRDPSAWYHIVAVLDTTNGTSSNRAKLYVNGTQITAFSTATYPSSSASYDINNTTAHSLGSYINSASVFYDGYLTEINFIDGQALTPSSFGGTNAVTGVWEPRQYTGTYGTNGFYLNFKDNTSTTTLGYDYSGNSNNWTTNNISLTAGSTYDSMLDVPTQWIGYGNAYETTRGNYATLSPIDINTAAAPTITNGNLTYTANGGMGARSTISMSSGKWYCEVTANAAGNMLGIVPTDSSIISTSYPGSIANSYGYYATNGNKYYYSGGATNAAYGATYTTNDVVGIAFDADAGTLTYYKNGVSQGTAFTGIAAGSYSFAFGNGTSSGSFNFGQRPFSYTPPSGYLPLCTTNLSSPTILQGNQYFDATLYTGTAANQTITNAGSLPVGLVWIKDRSAARQNSLSDIVRGTNKELFSDSTDPDTSPATPVVTAFNSNGFSIGANGVVNATGESFVAWQWAGNGSGSSNTAGTITSTVSANTTSGFSIVTYTGNGTNGATVGHGLGVAPKMVIVKERSGTYEWPVYHASLTSGYMLFLNLTQQEYSIASRLNGGVSATSSTTFTCTQGSSTLGNVNASSQTYVAYCFAEIAGYSKFGSYTGNGSTDGPFIYTGFRPRYVMIKKSSDLQGWYLLDTARAPYNVVGPVLEAQSSAAEVTGNQIDILSNGFKVRESGNGTNTSGGTYIYAAFAENPFKNALAR